MNCDIKYLTKLGLHQVLHYTKDGDISIHQVIDQEGFYNLFEKLECLNCKAKLTSEKLFKCKC